MIWYDMIYDVMIWYDMIYYIILYYVMLCYIILYYTMLCYIILYYIILCYVTLYYIILYYIILYYIILMLCYIILYYTEIVENIKTHILRSKPFFRKSYHYWDNVEKYDRPRQTTGTNAVKSRPFACWITKATHTNSEYVILLDLAWQQRSRERA